jgi:hypothetical protein
MSRFPELKNQESDFFSKTKAIVQRIVAATPEKRNDPTLLEFAATQAENELLREQIANRGKRERADAQMPSRGERAAGGGEADEPMSLGPQQLQVMRSFGLTEDQFKRNMTKRRSA